MYKVATFYTINTPYAVEVQHLLESCKQFNIPYICKGLEPRGSWVANCAMKPEYISSLLQEVDHDILWLDADAVINSYPILFDNFDGDIGVHYKDGRELISSTIYFRNTANVKRLVALWCHHQKCSPTTWDQKVLQSVINNHAKSLDLKIVRTPPTYTQIFDLMRGAGVPVISQYQASRRFKKTVGG
jgi:hypothetical protein